MSVQFNLKGGNGMKTILCKDESKGITIGYDDFDQLCVLKVQGDRSEQHYGIGDPRGHKCLLCGSEWENTVTSFLNQYYLRDRKSWVHESCFINHMSLNHYELVHSALVDAHVRFDGFQPIPNEYGGAWNTDWFHTNLLDHKVSMKFGRRKRVYVIHFSGQFELEPVEKLEEFFNKEKVTCDFDENTVMVHAWNDEKVYEYVKVIAETLGLQYKV
jgi:hypothetical protein